MRATLWAMAITTLAGVAALGVVASSRRQDGGPQYAGKNVLVRPADYREWIYLSSGLGMNYGGGQREAPVSKNFFWPPPFRGILSKRHWAEHTIIVIRGRCSANPGLLH